jgi:hypothetical protein
MLTYQFHQEREDGPLPTFEQPVHRIAPKLDDCRVHPNKNIRLRSLTEKIQFSAPCERHYCPPPHYVFKSQSRRQKSLLNTIIYIPIDRALLISQSFRSLNEPIAFFFAQKILQNKDIIILCKVDLKFLDYAGVRGRRKRRNLRCETTKNKKLIFLTFPM